MMLFKSKSVILINGNMQMVLEKFYNATSWMQCILTSFRLNEIIAKVICRSVKCDARVDFRFP